MIPPHPLSLALALSRQRPQQAIGCGEEVDGRRSVGDEGGLQPQSLEHLNLQEETPSVSLKLRLLKV